MKSIKMAKRPEISKMPRIEPLKFTDTIGSDESKNSGPNNDPKKIKLRIGVFFDGTGNNKYNSDSVYYKQTQPLVESAIPKVRYKNFEVERGSSYWNSYSNIALLHDLYEEKTDFDKAKEYQNLQLKVYIQGIGTLRDKKDDKWGTAFGEGERGVIARVDEAFKMITDGIETALKKNKTAKNKMEIYSIQFDVFGFSRGAAAARHFCNEVLKTGNENKLGASIIKNVSRLNQIYDIPPKEISPRAGGYYKSPGTKKVIDKLAVRQDYVLPPKKNFTSESLGKYLKDNKITFPKYYISVEFLGIFDTVISQILEKTGIIDTTKNPFVKTVATGFNPLAGIFTYLISRIPKVNTTVNNPNIRKIVHLQAQTEWRENFPITPIGKISKSTLAKEIKVLGAHSDIGGGYWQTKEELNILHFFDLGVNAKPSEKQNMEKQKKKLIDWYISEQFCKPGQIKWITKHHVYNPSLNIYQLKDEDFMENETTQAIDGIDYTLSGYRYELHSTRPLSNKLSLVYMNVMKDMAQTYAGVPFNLPVDRTKHPEEYEYSKNKKDKAVIKKMEEYKELIKKATENGWNTGKQEITYPSIVDYNGKYTVDWATYQFIMKNYVHLSANFSPLFEILEPLKINYINAPRFINEKEFKDPPYKRETYTPDTGNK